MQTFAYSDAYLKRENRRQTVQYDTISTVFGLDKDSRLIVNLLNKNCEYETKRRRKTFDKKPVKSKLTVIYFIIKDATINFIESND